MGKKRVKQPPPRRRTWRRSALAALVLVAVGGGTFWWLSEPPDAAGGTPRLVVDQTDVDLGYLPFNKQARVVFTLTNAGDGPLKLVEVPQVKVIEGC